VTAHPAAALWPLKHSEPVWYTNPWAIPFRAEIATGVTTTLHPTWGPFKGFDHYHPCGFHIGAETAASFHLEQLVIEGHPQWLGLNGGRSCPAVDYSHGAIPYGSTCFEACPFGGRIDLRVHNGSTKSALFVASLSGPVRVAQSVVDDVARADWSALTGPQRRAVLRYGHHYGGGFPRKEENRKALDEALIAFGLVAVFDRLDCLPTARGLALAAQLARTSEAPPPKSQASRERA